MGIMVCRINYMGYMRNRIVYVLCGFTWSSIAVPAVATQDTAAARNGRDGPRNTILSLSAATPLRSDQPSDQPYPVVVPVTNVQT